MPAKKSAVPSEDRVREIAHKLWLDAGQPEGHAEAHWAQAQEMAAKEMAKPSAKKAAPARKPAPAKAEAPAAAPAPVKKAAPARKAAAPARKPAKA